MRKPFEGDYQLTQGFNDPRFREDYYQFGLVGHNGLDFGMDSWTPILAPHQGICKEVFDEGNVGYGKYIKVESEIEGSILAHLAKFSVEQGQQVEEGQAIGYSGNSGNSTGPHTHWGYYRTQTRNRKNGFNGYLDPTDWLDHQCSIPSQDEEFTFNFLKESFKKLKDRGGNVFGNLEGMVREVIEVYPKYSQLAGEYSIAVDQANRLVDTISDLTGQNITLEKELKIARETAKKAVYTADFPIANYPTNQLFLELVRRILG